MTFIFFIIYFSEKSFIIKQIVMKFHILKSVVLNRLNNLHILRLKNYFKGLTW